MKLSCARGERSHSYICEKAGEMVCMTCRKVIQVKGMTLPPWPSLEGKPCG